MNLSKTRVQREELKLSGKARKFKKKKKKKQKEEEEEQGEEGEVEKKKGRNWEKK